MKNWIASLSLLGLLAGCGGGGSSSSSSPPAGGASSASSGTSLTALFNQSLKWVDSPFGSPRQISPAGLLVTSVGSPSISQDGRYVMFLSDDSTLVPNDTNGGVDLFVRDTEAGITYRRNVLDIADQSITNVTSYYTIPNFTNLTGVTFSVANPENDPAGPRFYESGPNTMSFRARGQIRDSYNLTAALWALESRPTYDPTGPLRIRLYDQNIADIDKTKDEFILTHANADCLFPRFGGNRVFFYSEATNLVANDTNGAGDIFAYDILTGQVTLVSCLAGGGQLNARSDPGEPTTDGRYYVFSTRASNGAVDDNNNASDVFVKDLSTGELSLISRPSPALGGFSNGDSGNPIVLSPFNGVVFQSNASNLVANDTNNAADVFYWAPPPRNRVTTRLNFGLNLTPAQGGSNTLRQCVVNHFGSYCAYTTDASLGLGASAGAVHLYRSLCVYPLTAEEASLPQVGLP